MASWLVLASTAVAQIITPSNNSQDLYPIATSPRFLLNGSQIHDIPTIKLAPLGDYARMAHSSFVEVNVDGHLVNVDATNVNDVSTTKDPNNEFMYLSCDPEDYSGNLDASDIFRIAVNQPLADIVILYSRTSDHCSASGLDNLPAINGILTTTGSMASSMLADLNLTEDSDGSVTILPDLNAYTNNTRGSDFSSGFGQSPTTAVAMIILYSITGIITALFVVIIVTGAIRAHRHPERYGPRTILGGGRQSRAKGIARAMLETIPIVKFGDRAAPAGTVKDSSSADVEMNATPQHGTPEVINTDASSSTDAVPSTDVEATATGANADGTDAEGHLGCSICTEDFTKGEEVRVLPCNHKFHPDCVDPWLLNVSGTCPLCRIDLRPQASDAAGTGTATDAASGELPPPLGGERRASTAANDTTGTGAGQAGRGGLRRDTITQLRRLAAGTNEERITALRRYRLERREPAGAGAGEGAAAGSGEREQDEGERRGLARRLRERFRVTTERRGTVVGGNDYAFRGTFAGPVRGG